MQDVIHYTRTKPNYFLWPSVLVEEDRTNKICGASTSLVFREPVWAERKGVRLVS